MIDGAPGYWRNETSGVLEPAVKAYLAHDELTPAEIAALRKQVDGLTSRQAIARWLDKAIDAGIDPL